MRVPTEDLLKPTGLGSVLIVGNAGTGKTYSIASLHRWLRLHGFSSKIIFFDFDGDGSDALLALARDGRESKNSAQKIAPWVEDIELYRYNKTKASLGVTIGPAATAPSRDADIATEFHKDFNDLESRLEPGNRGARKWKAGQESGIIVFDSLTSLHDIYEDFLFVLRKREIGGINMNNVNSKTGEPADAVNWDDWRLLGEKVSSAYMTAKQMPCFLVCTAHEDYREESVKAANPKRQPMATGQYHKMPLLTTSLAKRIAKDFGIVLYTTPDFKWHTRATEGNHVLGAKSRFRDNLPLLCEQDFANILEA
jgi:AAA domain